MCTTTEMNCFSVRQLINVDSYYWPIWSTASD